MKSEKIVIDVRKEQVGVRTSGGGGFRLPTLWFEPRTFGKEHSSHKSILFPDLFQRRLE